MKKVQARKIRNNTKRIAKTLYYFTYGKPIPMTWRKPGIEREVLAVLETR